MQPLVILDTNALYGRKPFTQPNSVLLLALAEFGHVRLIVPEVVLLELSRQWLEEAQVGLAELRAGARKLNGVLVDVGLEPARCEAPEPDRHAFYGYAEGLLRSKGVDIPPPPQVSVRDLLVNEIELRKPFARQGTGFRDALIWENVRELCGALEDPATPVVFVTNNHTDFCDKKSGSLHPDLRRDLGASQTLDVVSSLHHLLAHRAISPLVELYRVLENTFTRERLEKLVDSAIADLHGAEVEQALGVYVGHGMYSVPISTGLSDAVFDEIEVEENTISSEIYRIGEELTIRVTVDANCSFDGYIDKSDYWILDEPSGISVQEDWNDYVYSAYSQGRLRFTFSASFTGVTMADVALALDGAEEI